MTRCSKRSIGACFANETEEGETDLRHAVSMAMAGARLDPNCPCCFAKVIVDDYREATTATKLAPHYARWMN